MLKNNLMKIVLIVVSVLVVVIISGVAILITSMKTNYDEGPPTTKTLSNQFATKEEKLQFLKKYFKEYSQINDAEYFIEYHNNSNGWVPGPSEWDIRVALKVSRDKISNWTTDFDKVNEKDIQLSWWDFLKKDDKKWQRDSKPRFYKRKDQMVYIVVYEKEGIILKRIATM